MRDFKAEYLPDTVNPFLAELEIKDLLSMSTGQNREASSSGTTWVKTFLETPVEFEPGVPGIIHIWLTELLDSLY